MTLWIKCIFLIMLVIGITGCQRGKSDLTTQKVNKFSVVTTLFPTYDFARFITGDKGTVSLLLPPGVEAHSFEPKPSDIIAIGKSDIFIFTNKAMEPWAARVIKGVVTADTKVVDASGGINLIAVDGKACQKNHNHESETDPHVWLDLSKAVKMVENIETAIAEKDSKNRAYYAERGQLLKNELHALDAAYNTALAKCNKTFIHGGHFVFGYLASRYGLIYRSAQAANPDAEPTPAGIAELVNLVRQSGVKNIFTEELVSPRLSEVIAREAGVKILKLHGAHNVSLEEMRNGTSFTALMRKNLETLKQGLSCQ